MVGGVAYQGQPILIALFCKGRGSEEGVEEDHFCLLFTFGITGGEENWWERVFAGGALFLSQIGLRIIDIIESFLNFAINVCFVH
jgi:hypothetical protein